MITHEEEVRQLQETCRVRRRKAALLAALIGGAATIIAVTMSILALNLFPFALIGWLIIGTFTLKMARSKFAEIALFERIHLHRKEDDNLAQGRRYS